jgi:Flp pilus assembly protein TadG
MLRKPQRTGPPRRGIAIAELAVVLSLLLFISLAACDFGRVSYNSSALSDRAANGALYGSSSGLAAQMPYTSIQAAALAEWPAGLSPQPIVTSQTTTAADGTSYIAVTVTQDFATIVNYPLVPSTVHLNRTVWMVVTQ